MLLRHDEYDYDHQTTAVFLMVVHRFVRIKKRQQLKQVHFSFLLLLFFFCCCCSCCCSAGGGGNGGGGVLSLSIPRTTTTTTTTTTTGSGINGKNTGHILGVTAIASAALVSSRKQLPPPSSSSSSSMTGHHSSFHPPDPALPTIMDYDMVIIGAGESGIYAAGMASSTGSRTLLLEKVRRRKTTTTTTTTTDIDDHNHNHNHNNESSLLLVVGGDCSNAACVPSRALRSMAKIAETHRRAEELLSRNGPDESSSHRYDWFRIARQHIDDTVNQIRIREDASSMSERNPNLDLKFVTGGDQQQQYTTTTTNSTTINPNGCRFLSPYELQIQTHDAVVPQLIRAKSFVIATGASPIIPPHLKDGAKQASVPLYTYRNLLQPEGGAAADNEEDQSIWNILQTKTTQPQRPPSILIAGGGATACELGQSLARLGRKRGLRVVLTAPNLLPTQDATIQNAAYQMLTQDGIDIRLTTRLKNIRKRANGDGDSNSTGGTGIAVLDDGSEIPVDAVVLCLGRSPGSSLSSLNLDAARVKWSPEGGVHVNDRTLRSVSNRRVFACGDCSSAVLSLTQQQQQQLGHHREEDRRAAAHGAWTGFHVVRNIAVPWILRAFSPSIHPAVPRVIYTDLEMASVGMSYSECVRKYGNHEKGGFVSLFVPEEGSDRADMDRYERCSSSSSSAAGGKSIAFVELRATRIGGKILGMTACGPAAAELANEIGLALHKKATVMDIAKSLHSYPSHGYLLYRTAFAIATSTTWGLLETFGPGGAIVASGGRMISRLAGAVKKGRPNKKQKQWQYDGAKQTGLVRIRPSLSKSSSHVTTNKENDEGNSEVVKEEVTDSHNEIRSFFQIYEEEKKGGDVIWIFKQSQKRYSTWKGSQPK